MSGFLLELYRKGSDILSVFFMYNVSLFKNDPQKQDEAKLFFNNTLQSENTMIAIFKEFKEQMEERGLQQGLQQGKEAGLREGSIRGKREGKIEGKIEGLLEGKELDAW